jgi:hypothetical protein
VKHWEHRPEARWKDFQFNQPYAKGLTKLREVLATTDFDPATLWQWGTMQAMALIEVLKSVEGEFGEEGQKLVFAALQKVGRDVGRQILDGTRIPEGMSEAEFVSFYATVLNRIAYASLEAPRIDASDKATFDILWCPHQDHYGPYDCRVQRYFVQGMIDAAKRPSPPARRRATSPCGCRPSSRRAPGRRRRPSSRRKRSSTRAVPTPHRSGSHATVIQLSSNFLSFL